MEFELNEALKGLRLSEFQAWSDISDQLREPKLFGVDYDVRDFHITESGEISGIADIMLTYRGDFLGALDESLTLPASVTGIMADGRAVITDVRVSL